MPCLPPAASACVPTPPASSGAPARVRHALAAVRGDMAVPGQWANQPLRSLPSPSATRAPGGDAAHDLARHVLDRHPVAAQMLLAGLARDHGGDAEPASLIQALARHRSLVQRVDERLATQGAAGYQALQRQLRMRAPWVTASTVFEQALSARRRRDLDRSDCRNDSRQRTPVAEDAAPDAGPPGQQRMHGERLRLRTMVQAATAALLLGAQARGAEALQRSDQQALIPAVAAAGLPALCSPGPARAVAVSGTALVMTGLALWATLPSRPAAGSIAGVSDPLAPAAPSAALETLRYLDQHRGRDGDTLLEGLLWREAGDPLAPAQIFASLPADSLARMQDLAGPDTPLGPWLAALLDLHGPTGATAPFGQLRQVRRVRSVGDASHAAGSSSAPAGIQVAACRAIAPAIQPLAGVERATLAVTSDAVVAQVPDDELSAFAGCLQALQDSLQVKRSALLTQLEQAAGSFPLQPEVDAVRRQTLGRLVTRTRQLSQRVHDALVQSNVRILAVLG